MNDSSVIPVSIEQEMKTSFIDYSMSVIVSRALPDVRDGLKPVHRRILYAMYGLKNFHNRPYLKSARIVGDVIGKYHPHGDSAVYDALVRMAQNFSLRYPLIDGQGNFGSVDGDSPAAMRYTESRMEALSEKMLEDLEKDTVDFVPNYDNKDLEPLVLPAKFPQLLVNGASGIAVGMATNIPPHNMTEVLSALEALIDDPDISVEGLMNYVKGPDFPTAGEIHGTRGIYDAYHTGRGSITIRAKTEIETLKIGGGRERIIISEIPFQVNKAKLIEKIADLVREKKIEGISDIRDESAKEEIRIVIDVKKAEPAEIVLNNLYSMTAMQTNFGVNLVALTGGLPKLLNLKEMLECFFLHRQEVLLRRTKFLLEKAQEKAHILLGLKVAVESLDQVVQLIRQAPDVSAASEGLKKLLGLTEVQAKAILDMRLARLTGLERDKIALEYESVQKEIQGYKEILMNREILLNMIRSEIRELKQEFSEPRRTQIFLGNADHFTMESLIPNEEVAVIITHSGYAKRTSLTEIASQKRGGKGRSGMLTKEEDAVENLFISTNHQSLICFTDKGRVYCLKVYQLPEAPLRGRGQHLANLIKFEGDERIVSILPVEKFVEDHFITSVTKRGYIKKTDLMAYSQVRSTGIIGLKLDEGDELIKCLLTGPKDHILLATKFGKAIRFAEEDLRPVGRVSRGVVGIGFSEENDEVIGMAVLKPDVSEDKDSNSAILSVCENGYGKRTPLEEYRIQSRAGKGIYTVKVTGKTGPVVGIAQVYPQDELMVMTSSGKLTRFSIEEVGVIGRMTQGVRLVNLGDGEKVISFGRVPKTDSIEEGEPHAPSDEEET